MTDPRNGQLADGAAGIAEPRSLGALLRHWARRRPDALALADPPDREALGFGPPLRLTFREAEAVVARLSDSMTARGLRAGDVLAIQLPNIAELTLAMLAALRAGLVPSPLPWLWRSAELRAAFARVPVAAAIGCGNAAVLAEMTRAAPPACLLFGFGGALPAGVTDLSPCLDPDDAPAPPTDGAPPAADDLALIGWGFDRRTGLIAIPRSHRELTAAGLMPVLEIGLKDGDILLNPYSPASLTGLAGMVVPWLLTGATLVLHQPFDKAVFLRQLAAERATVTAIPAPVIAALADTTPLAAVGPALRVLVCVWPQPHAATGSPALPDDRPMALFSMGSLREFALLVRPLAAAGLPLGPVATPAGRDGAVILMETRMRGRSGGGAMRDKVLAGELCLRGPAVPALSAAFAAFNPSAPLMRDAEGFLNTGIPCAPADEAMTALICRPDPELAYHGGLLFGMAELDQLYAEFPDVLDAAAFIIDDPLMGGRVFAAVVPTPGVTPLEGEFRAYLEGLDVAPFKIPEKLVVVTMIPRDGQGRVLRHQILDQI